jgi:PDZ domain
MFQARVTLVGLALTLLLLGAGCGGAGLFGLGGGGGDGDVGSVGAVFSRDNETRALVVREAAPGAGAEKAGLLPGDQVVMIDGWYVRGMSTKDIRARLRGEIGTTVRLTVVRGMGQSPASPGGAPSSTRGDEVHHLQVRRLGLAERRALPPREERIAE